MGNFLVVWFCTSPNQITVEEFTLLVRWVVVDMYILIM